ncbi:MAG: hypothetical protein WBP11_13175 [Dokdonella sp.]
MSETIPEFRGQGKGSFCVGQPDGAAYPGANAVATLNVTDRGCEC